MNLTIPKEIAIFGPGPSLDTVDYSKVVPFRLCLSFTYLVVENPTAVISKDGHALKGQRGTDLLVFCPNPERYATKYYVDISGLPSTNGTLELAVLASHELGARKIHFYGIDSHFGEGGYAKKMKQVNLPFTPAPASMRSYEEILANTKKILDKNKIEGVFHDGN